MPPAKQMQAAVKVSAEGKKFSNSTTSQYFCYSQRREKGYLTIQQGKQQVLQ